MAVPGFQNLMLPLLRVLADGRDHTPRECADAIAAMVNLTEADRSEPLPSRRQSRFDNRVHWAATYLAKAGLVERPVHGRLRITAKGRAVLEPPPAIIDLPFLESISAEFREFRKRESQTAAVVEKSVSAAALQPAQQTPEEVLEAAYRQVRAALAQDLLERIGGCSPAFFERLVVDLLVAMGYGGPRQDAGQAVGRSGDGGIDGIIKEDHLGLDFVYLQAKRWDRPVGRPEVQTFAGSLEGRRARKGVFITTSRFTDDAWEYVKHIEKRIVLIDGDQLAQYMIDFGVGVADQVLYRVRRLDVDYFDES